MNVRYLAEDFAVAPQVTPAELAGLRNTGVATLICNRPDGEGAGQPAFAELASEAALHGIEAHYLPVVPGKITQSDVAAFAAILANAPRPVLAYCRTGLRAETLWQLAASLQRNGGGT